MQGLDRIALIAKFTERHTFKLVSKRWAVERSFMWLANYRRLEKNCERLLNTGLRLIQMASWRPLHIKNAGSMAAALFT
jgi:transposase